MATAAERAEELKAANTVRRLIQRVRLATPDNFDTLETELFDAMEKNLEKMGSQLEKVQEEIDKALEAARKRVEQLREKKEKEELLAQRPKELIEEIKELMEVLQARISTLKMAACLEGIEGVELQPDDAEAVVAMAAECAAEIKEFSAACVTRANEIKEAALPPDTKKTWTALAHEIVEVKRKSEVAVAQAKAATIKATQALRKQQLEDQKMLITAKLQDAAAVVPTAEMSLKDVEVMVEPFVKGRPLKDEEYVSLAERVEAAMTEAQIAVKNAKDELKPLDQEAEFAGLPEPVKKEMKAFVLAQEKMPIIRLGQFENRIQRIKNILATWKRERSSLKAKSVVDGIKGEFLDKVKAAVENLNVEEAEPVIKEAEQALEPAVKHKTMSFAELKELEATASSAADQAQSAFDSLKQELCPIDESLDEEVKKKLKAAAQPHLKKHQVKMGLYEKRLARVQTLLKTFRGEIEKRRIAEQDRVKGNLVKVARHLCSTHGMTAESLFATIAAESHNSSVIDQAAFLSYFAAAEKTVEGKEYDLPMEELAAFFTSKCAEGEDTMAEDTFVKLVANRMIVAKATTLTTVFSIAEGKVIRALRLNENLETLEGPVKEPKVGVMRVKVRTLTDGKEGWATLAGNAGTVFLKEA